MRLTVRLFARLRDVVGAAEIVREAPDGATLGDVWQSLVAEYPQLGSYTSVVSCARNEDYSRFSAVVGDGDEIAFLPPVSGG